jgi:hypothetical protein
MVTKPAEVISTRTSRKTKTGNLSAVGYAGLAILDHMAMHGLDQFFHGGSSVEQEFGVKPVDFEEIPVGTSLPGTWAVIPDLPETVCPLGRPYRDTDHGGFRDILRYFPYKFQIPCRPVNKTPARGGIGIIEDECKAQCEVRVNTPYLDRGRFVVTITRIITGETGHRDFHFQIFHFPWNLRYFRINRCDDKSVGNNLLAFMPGRSRKNLLSSFSH